MMLAIPQSYVIPKLCSDSESLTLSESCVKSDIANIIQKIYSPRPLMSGDGADSAVESRFIEENRERISRPKEEEEKRFGFHFESVTGHFAKTLVDSSTTSGSVSVPVVRHKPKRVRTVCDCCKRKIPHHVDETRAKRPYRDCRICKTNDCSVLGNSTSFIGVDKEVDPVVHNSTGRMKASNYKVVRINSGTIPNGHNTKMKVSNYEVRINPASRYIVHDRIQLSSMNLERKPSLTDLPNRVSENVSWSQNNENELNCSSVSNLQIVPNTSSNKRVNTSPRLSIHNLEEGKVKSETFLQRIMNNLVGKNLQSNSLEEGGGPGKKNTDIPKYAETKSSKTSMKLKKTSKSQINKHSSTNLHVHFDPVATSENLKNRHLAEEEMRKSTNTKEKNKAINPTLTSEKDYLEKVTVGKKTENIESEHKIEKDSTENLKGRQDFTTPLEEIEIHSSAKDEVVEKVHERQHKKYQVAYKSLTIEVDTDWAYEFWAGVFGTCHSVISFFTAFFLHLLTFVLQGLIQPLFCGTVRISSEHFFNPCLSTAFESVIQPLCKVVERLAGSLRDMSTPVAQCFGAFCKELSHICKACRVVEINKNYNFNEQVRNP